MKTQANGEGQERSKTTVEHDLILTELKEMPWTLRLGSYHAISGGWIAEGLLDLTGCPTETIELDAADSERTWMRLLSYAAAGFPMAGWL